MADNGKKEFPINGLEVDCISRFGRKYLCYVQNVKGIRKFVKNQMNRRMRKKGRINKNEY
jgi:hypothetical protein